mgnify:CR=1 FL=1
MSAQPKPSAFDELLAELNDILSKSVPAKPLLLLRKSSKPPVKTRPKPMLLFFKAPGCRDGIVLKTSPKPRQNTEKTPCLT